ncbi:MAG: hypothetical protein ABW198_08430, partial [Pseudorhodoplanes sp.]
AMMLMQSRAVVDIALGRDSGWQPQRRDDGQLTAAETLRTYLWPTIIGALLSASAYLISWSLFLWMTPVLIGLILAAPIATWTSSPKLGSSLKSAGILLTREESEPPPILTRANTLAAASPHRTPQDAFFMLATHERLLVAHRSMVASESPPRRGDYDLNLLLGQAKVRDASSVEDAIASFGPGETFAVLSDVATLTELFAKPLSSAGLPREAAPSFESADVNS